MLCCRAPDGARPMFVVLALLTLELHYKQTQYVKTLCHHHVISCHKLSQLKNFRSRIRFIFGHTTIRYEFTSTVF